MFKQRVSSKKFIFSFPILLAGVLLFVSRTLFAQTLPIGGREQTGQAGELGAANDFDNDIRLGLQNLTVNSAAQIQQKELQNEEYKSAWDEFGINVLVDGAVSPNEINKEIVQDVVQTVQDQLNYDRQEEVYFQADRITPEEIRTAEESTDSDVPPGESINPNPSLEENPDVSASSVENVEQNNPETGAGNTSEPSSAPENNVATMSAPEANNPSESTIFESILQGEQSSPPTEEPSPPVESPPEAPPAE